MGTNVAPVLLAGIAVLIMLALLARYLWRRKQGAKAVVHAAPAPAEGGEAAAAWRPPAQPDPPPPVTGPSLAAGIMLIRSEAGGLEVIWNALADGTLPVAVQWGAPDIRISGDTLELNYVYQPEEAPPAGFEAPRTRICQPGELVSRAIQVAWPQIGRGPAGLKVRVAVGYGSAEDLAQAAGSREAYLAWQRVAAARPRPVQGGS